MLCANTGMLSRDSFWVSLSITAHNTQTTNDDSKTLRGPHAPGTRDRTIFRLAVGGCVCTSYTSPKPWLAARRAGGPVGPYSSAPWERLSNTVRLPSDSPPTLPRARWCCPCSRQHYPCACGWRVLSPAAAKFPTIISLRLRSSFHTSDPSSLLNSVSGRHT